MEELRKRHAALKKELKMWEQDEVDALRTENESLKKDNAMLHERLVAARDVRREMDQERRQQQISAPVGTGLLRY